MTTCSDSDNAYAANSSPSTNETTTPAPIQIIKPRAADARRMQIVPAAGPFELPDGWILEVRPRAPGSSVKADKYYYEPETGRQFRSLPSIRRYLNGEEEYKTMPRQKHRRPIRTMDELEAAPQTNIKDKVSSNAQNKLSSILPDGWIVKKVPRKLGCRSDRYFIDPVNRLKFRSLPEVQRFLKGEEYSRKRKPMKLIDCSVHQESLDSRKENTSFEIVKDSNFGTSNPPEKVNWVFSGLGEDTWRPFIQESMVPDRLKELWAESFVLGMTGRRDSVPRLTKTEIDPA
ncbi:hypothetical protein Nepgr_014148 [Nepenthes gracilis]|uniref:MBD domain-containing protein n=1 Tax=Nepenthes gracilis TaxID=150966 RepID=A0AAD3SJI2_NEPGR|nr:hypothetical protein Nepgr_014148 [Nepenthes gracilis]